MSICVGIDPGITGGVAVLYTTRGRAVVDTVSLYDTPVEQKKKSNGKNKTDYLPSQMAGILSDHVSGQQDVHAFIEQVSAMPGQGVTSMFGFGKGYGIWIGILAALGVPYTFVTPQRWKKELMQGQHDKEAAVGRALQLYPQCSAELTVRRGAVTKPQALGRADALLIAEAGRRWMK
jgi:crossover junction endodeoxyribonuclease RuvC